MTLPRRPHSTTSPSSTRQTSVTPTPLLTPEELTSIVDAEYQHVDYDRHPLKVQGLDHYIEAPPGDERFHIS